MNQLEHEPTSRVMAYVIRRSCSTMAWMLALPAIQARAAQTSFEDTVIQQVTGGQDHGAAIASGDVNGDGHLDLAVADPEWMLSCRAWILFGPEFSTELPIVIPDLSEWDFFGSVSGDWGLADLTGDGLADLYMSTNWSKAGTETTLVGRALVIAAPGFVQSVELMHPQPGVNAEFGCSMVAHDFTGDGLYDLAVTAPRATSTLGAQSAGRIDVFSGTDLGGPPVMTLEPTAPQAGKTWGWFIEVGDWDNDGIDDLLVNDRTEGILGNSYSW